MASIKVNIDISEIENQIAKLKKEIEDFRIMTSDVRILTGWTENERKELEEAEDNDFNSAIDLIRGIINDEDDCISLAKKYTDEYSDEDNQMVKDIADYYCGNAKFPEQKYYVHLIKGDENSYLNITSYGGAELDKKFEFGGWQTKFTRDEIISMNPQLVPFMEEVEADE